MKTAVGLAAAAAAVIAFAAPQIGLDDTKKEAFAQKHQRLIELLRKHRKDASPAQAVLDTAEIITQLTYLKDLGYDVDSSLQSEKDALSNRADKNGVVFIGADENGTLYRFVWNGQKLKITTTKNFKAKKAQQGLQKKDMLLAPGTDVYDSQGKKIFVIVNPTEAKVLQKGSGALKIRIEGWVQTFQGGTYEKKFD
jgi:hypothetical protein